MSGGVEVALQVQFRDDMGRFISAVETAATETIQDIVNDGADLARAVAPMRTGNLRDSIEGRVVSRARGEVSASASYARWQEEGAGPHDMPADVTFYWKKKGRMWEPPDVYAARTGFPGGDPIHHPGNPATHFMRAAQLYISQRFAAAAKKHYPG